MLEFVTFAALQFTNYLLITINVRAISHEQYAATALTDALISALGFALIQRVASATTWRARGGYVCGGAIGSVFGIWLTRAW